jgi:hypothetical protein
MRFLCKLFGHKMYSITWLQEDFSVLCTRCEKQWTGTERLGIHHE